MPKLQISWIENDPRIGEIDIDYRARGPAHLEPVNSDVRGNLNDVSHYCLYRVKYGDALIDWWNAEPAQCDEEMGATTPFPQEGWVYLGQRDNSENWAFDVEDVDFLQVGLVMRGKESRGAYLRRRSGNTHTQPLFIVDSTTCYELLNTARRGSAIWFEVRRAACE